MARDHYDDVYETRAEPYDELVAHEDHEARLPALLGELAPGAIDVVETGAGTGRLTRLLAPRARSVHAFDGSPAMIAVARRHLADAEHVTLGVATHDALPVEGDVADLAIEGWAFGHAVSRNPEAWRDEVRAWVTELDRVTRAGGRIVLIETMGTAVLSPFEGGHSLEPFDALVTGTLGFERHVVRTDYAFASSAEALRVLGFFFGERIEGKLARSSFERGGQTIVPEHTGVYVRRR